MHVSPDGIKDVKRDVESDFPRKTFDCDKYCIAEPQPSNQSQAEQRIANRRLVQVQHQARIEHL